MMAIAGLPRTTGISNAGTPQVNAARTALLASLNAVAIYQLAIELESVTAVTLSQYPGSALRGALVQALLDAHCTNKASVSCAACPLVRVCPVSALVAPLRDEAPRGRDVPRPFVLTPPRGVASRLDAGACWSFGLTLFGSAAALFPYLVLSRGKLEANGLGLRDEVGRRGRVRVRRIASVTGQRQVPVYEPGTALIGAPVASSGCEQVAGRAASLPGDRLTLRLETPLRLKSNGEILRTFQPAVLVHRILERWEGLRREYGREGAEDLLAPLRGSAEGAAGDPRALLAVADTIRVERDATRWLELASYSSRQQRFTPISGLVGEVTLAGNLEPLREVLALGELIHAGKDVVKGNGCYSIHSTGEAARRPWN